MTSLPELSTQSIADYYELEDGTNRGDVRHEYWDGYILAMTGGTPEHAMLAGAITASFNVQLQHSPCRVFSADLKVRSMAHPRIYYPDVVAVCGVLELDAEKGAVLNAVVAVEVLSRGTLKTDFESKLPVYQSMDRLRSILYVHQNERRIEVWAKLPKSGVWTWHEFTGGSFAVLGLSGVVLDVDGIYQGVLK